MLISPLHLLVRLAAAMAVLTSVGCRSIEVESEAQANFRLPQHSTWAFSAASARNTDLDKEIRGAIEAGMARLRLQQAPLESADVIVHFTKSIETLRRELDPYFAVYPLEDYEEGTLTVDLENPTSGERLWRGKGKSELRVSAVRLGLYDEKMTPYETQQNWRVTEKVGQILAQLEPHVTVIR